jgi:16S rRNA (cytosine967-C5)-methyltransferase
MQALPRWKVRPNVCCGLLAFRGTGAGPTVLQVSNRREFSGGNRPRASRERSFPAGNLATNDGSARARVARRIAEQANRYPDLLIEPLPTGGLEDRDAALAHAINDAVIRRWGTLAFLLNEYVKQPLRDIEPGLQGVLLSGAAQLLFFDRVPPHAVLNESVELAKRLVRPGAAGMVNAVLRRVAELPKGHEARPVDWAERRDLLPLGDGRALLLTAELLPADPLLRLAVTTSHPPALIRRWSSIHPRERLRALALHTLVTPPTVLNTTHAAQGLPESLLPHGLPGHHVFTGTRAELVPLLESRSDIWVQDAASSRAVAAAAHLKPSLIVDLCAGQGTKTRQLAATFPQARIIATDVDAHRFATLSDVFRASTQVEVRAFSDALAHARQQTDLVLVDVPCSNTGVLARRPEARYRVDRQRLEELVAIQREIVAAALPLLRTGGYILYSTCSIEREENEFQADWASGNSGLRVEGHALLLPAGLPGDSPPAYHDGSFHALLTSGRTA